jgi:hypothetical protein
MRTFACVVVLALAVVSCGADDTASEDTGSTASTSATTETTTTETTTTETTTTETTITTVPTTATSTPATTTGATSEPCEPPTGTDRVSVDFPMGMSSLVGADIRTGAHPCFERVVLELQGDGEMPGYRVEYVDDPVKLSPSDLEVDIAGDATLVLSVAVWMTTMEGDGYDGPDRIEPTNVEHIDELRLIENFEGMHQWAIGLDRERAFRVTTLTDPPRIVVDIAS